MPISLPEWYQSWPFNVRAIVADKAREFKIEHEQLIALVMLESRGNPNAVRCEFDGPHRAEGGNLFRSLWKYHLNVEAWADRIGSSPETEWIGQATSWGLGQIMGTVAREYGFDGWFPRLCDPATGLHYTCKHLKRKMETYGSDPADAYAAYNAGSVRKTKGGHYVNQLAVNNYMKFYRELL